MPDDAELKRLAEAATPGEWESGGADDRGQAVVSMPSGLCAIVTCSCLATLEPEVDPTAAFIAAANPDTILRLLRERDEARADVFLCCQKLGRVRALASAWDGDTTRLRRVEAASMAYRALDEEPGALEALDADQGEGDGT